MTLIVPSKAVLIFWAKVCEIKWKGLLDLILQMSDTCCNPDVNIVHLGGDYTEISFSPKKKSVTKLQHLFLVFSQIVPCRVWFASSKSNYST